MLWHIKMLIKFVFICVIGWSLIWFFKPEFLFITDIWLGITFNKRLPAKVFFTKQYVKKHPEIEGKALNYGGLIEMFNSD